jgi:hypothetical protein
MFSPEQSPRHREGDRGGTEGAAAGCLTHGGLWPTLEQELHALVRRAVEAADDPRYPDWSVLSADELKRWHQIIDDMGEARARRWANELMQPTIREYSADELTVEDELPDGTVERRTFRRTDG